MRDAEVELVLCTLKRYMQACKSMFALHKLLLNPVSLSV